MSKDLKFSIRMTSEQVNRLDKLCESIGTDRSECIRRLIANAKLVPVTSLDVSTSLEVMEEK